MSRLEVHSATISAAVVRGVSEREIYAWCAACSCGLGARRTSCSSSCARGVPTSVWGTRRWDWQWGWRPARMLRRPGTLAPHALDLPPQPLRYAPLRRHGSNPMFPTSMAGYPEVCHPNSHTARPGGRRARHPPRPGAAHHHPSCACCTRVWGRPRAYQAAIDFSQDGGDNCGVARGSSRGCGSKGVW